MCITCRGKYSATVNPHVRGSSRVGDDPAHLSAGETARLNPKHDLVAVDGVNVEMDGHSTAAPLPGRA